MNDVVEMEDGGIESSAALTELGRMSEETKGQPGGLFTESSALPYRNT
jgi:hypothetical protein